MLTFGKLKEYIGLKIDTATTINVVGNKIALDKVYPCVVMKFPTCIPEEAKEDWILELDFWDKEADNDVDSTDILTAVELVKVAMNRSWQVETGGFFKSYLEFEGEIPDDTVGVYHFNQRYQITMY